MIDRAALLREIVEYNLAPRIRPDDITAKEYAEEAGIGRTTAMRHFKDMAAESSEWETLIVKDGEGRSVRVLRKVGAGDGQSNRLKPRGEGR